MRASSMQPAGSRALWLLLAGGALLALALTLVIAGQWEQTNGGGRPDLATDPLAASNGTIAFWEERVQRDPADFVAYNRLARAYAGRARETGDVADYTRAEAAVTASLNALPRDNYDATALLASLQLTKHEFRLGLETARAAMAIDPNDAYAHAVIGDAQLALGQYDEAQRTYEALVAEAPGLSSFSREASLYELRGDLAAAEAAWQNALSTDGGRRPESSAWARVQFGNFYWSQGRLDDARGQYESALAYYPGYIHALAGLARLAAASGNFERAIALYGDVTARQPLPEYVIALGDTYGAAGRQVEAQRQYDLVGAIDALYRENGINTDLQMAIFKADHGADLGEAMRQAQAVYDAQPDNIYAADALAWALYKSGRPQEAVTYSQTALRLSTQDPLLLFHAGVIHASLGDVDEARGLLGWALELNPDFSLLHAAEAASTLQSLGGAR